MMAVAPPEPLPYSSLDEALRRNRYPLANLAFIKRFATAIEMEGYFETTTYIKAVCTDGGPDLHTHCGGKRDSCRRRRLYAPPATAPRPSEAPHARDYGESDIR